MTKKPGKVNVNQATKPALRRYFLDTEFNDAVKGLAADFISIGLVREDGRGYHGVSKKFNLAAAEENDFLKKHVLPKLPPSKEWQSLKEIRKNLLNLIQPSTEAEFWSRNGSYDNVFLCRLFGGMSAFCETLKKEKGITKVTFRDINELRRDANDPKLPYLPDDKAHHSLNDADHERYVYGLLMALKNKL